MHSNKVCRFVAFFIFFVLIVSPFSLPQRAFSQESFPSELTTLSIHREPPRFTLTESASLTIERKQTRLSLPNWEEISALLHQKEQETLGDYCLLDLYLVSSQKDLIETMCTRQGAVPRLLGEKINATPLEKNLAALSELAWGRISAKTSLNLGIGSEFALEFYLAEENNPTLMSEDITRQLAFFDDLRSRILAGTNAVVKSKSVNSKQKSSDASNAFGLPIAPLFKWNTAGLVLKWKW
jgi:hypothetical protein